MDDYKFAPATLASLAKRLPQGYDAKNVRVVRATATVLPVVSPQTAAEAALLASLEKAGGVPMITDGQPTTMRVVAWVAHEGINNNRLAFVAEDLQEVASTIKAPNLLPMDFNHSAVNSWVLEQAVIGVWYEAEYVQDPRARLPRGPGGVLARGLVWSWLFPEYSTRLLAEQARHGHVEFSMACIPKWTETATDENGEYEIAREPVFFTFSALDTRPADPDAKGLAVEGTTDADVEADLRRKLTTAARNAAVTQRTEGIPMEAVDKILEFLQAHAGQVASQETLEGLVELVRAQPGQLAELTGSRDAAQARVRELEGRVQELDTALAAAREQVTAAQTTITSLEETVGTLTAELEEFRTQEEARTSQQTLQTRLAALPEHIRRAHESQEESKRREQETRWATKTEIEWQEVLDTFALVPPVQTASFLDRSRQEGRLPSAGTSTSVESLSKFRS
jgi:hypothetical protein